jgi:hypothetical protein
VRAARLLAALPLALATGCAWSLVADGRIREEPFAEIVARTAAVRGDPRPAQVDARVIGAADVPAVMRASIESELEPAEIARYQERLVAIGLWPQDRDLVDEMLRVAQEEVAGFYVSDTRTLYVVEDLRMPFPVRLLSALLRRDLLREAVLSHEVVHLLQHRAAPGLFTIDDWTEQDDASEAVQAALEGDATHFGLLAVLAGDPSGLPDPAELERSFDAAARGEGTLAEAPALVRLTLTFPYAGGYPLSLAEGPALLDDPPVSTEQVLHAERRRANFQVADLAALEAALPEGCESLGQNTLGELGISVLLSDLGAAAQSAAASDGWDGDRYLAARCGGRRAFLWWTAWDTEADAEEFAGAYAEIAGAVAARAGLAAPPAFGRDGVRVLVASGPLGALLPRLDPGGRFARIATLDELRAHFGLDGANE